jgi:hypothetical protein
MVGEKASDGSALAPHGDDTGFGLASDFSSKPHPDA